MEHRRNEYLISTDQSKLNIPLIYSFLKNTFWAKNISLLQLETCIQNSLCFGVYHANEQIGFGRVVTDFSRFAFFADVFVIETYQGRGLGKWLVECMINHPRLQEVPTWRLCTRDAHGLYRQFGFEVVSNPERYMERVVPVTNKIN